MLVAGSLIQRELQDAPGCERYANVIAGLREFWTLTIWRDASDMRSCMRGGTHGRVMWQQPHWLQYYWGMHWRPGLHRSGQWEGDAWPWPDLDAPEPNPLPAPEATRAMPSWIQAALGRVVPTEQRQVSGAAGATYRLRVPPWEFPSALRELRRLRRIASAERDMFTLSLGLGTGGALYLLLITTSSDALERIRATPEHRRFLERWGDRAWWSTWEPQAEFGHRESHTMRDGQLAHEPLLVDARLPAGPIAPREARRTLRARLQLLDAASLEVLELLTSELVANSARHAGLKPADRIGLQVRTKRDWVRVEVIDCGRQFEPRIPLSKSSEDGSGWGLYMVNQLADRWGIISRPPDRHVWFELRVAISDDRSQIARTRAIPDAVESDRSPAVRRPA
jgi:anti-sigma regulatory factor (Ser/Thr protein kinase)